MPKRVLVVDDSILDRRIHCKILEMLGHTYFEAFNGEEGVERAKELLPDLIIMDVVMPKMDGLYAIRALKKDPKTKKIPVIICSSKDKDNDIAWAKAQGAIDYVTKPISANIMAQKIISIIGK